MNLLYNENCYCCFKFEFSKALICKTCVGIYCNDCGKDHLKCDWGKTHKLKNLNEYSTKKFGKVIKILKNKLDKYIKMNDYIMNMPNTEQLHKKLMVHDEVKDIILKGKKFVEKNIEIKELASMGYMLLMSSKKQDQIVFIKAKRLIQVLDNLEMNFKAIEIINELNIAFTKLEAKNDKILKDTSNVVTKLKNKMTILQNECEKAIDKIINTSLPNIAKKYKETLNSYKGKERKTIYHFYDKNGETKGFDDAQQQEFIKYSLKTNKDIVKDYTVRMEELMEEKRLLENSVIQLKADSTILKFVHNGA